MQGFGARGLVSCPNSWPIATLEQVLGKTDPLPSYSFSPDSATLPLLYGGVWRLERDGLRGTLTTPRPLDPDYMAHPGLAGAACILAFWLGHEIFHAGAFVVDGGAWAVVGDKEAGKTTLLAHLHLAGVPIVADDMLVIDSTARAMAAPRCLDLRPDASKRLAADVRIVRSGDRHRIELGDVEPEMPMRGWIRLERSETESLHKVRPYERPGYLSAARTMRNVPTDPGALVRLAELPFYEFKRPLRWDDSSAVVERLLNALP